MASFLSLRPSFSLVPADLRDDAVKHAICPERFGFKTAAIVKENRLSCVNKFELNCSAEREMDVSTSALVGGLADAECLDEMKGKEPSISTMLVNLGNDFDPYDAISTPIYQTATFKQPSASENGPYDYTRSGNPTRDVLERFLAKLDKADRAFCFSSGMAALTAVTRLIGTGEEIVAGDDIYGGSDRLLSQVIPKTGIVVKRVNTTELDEVASAIGDQTKLVWLESPTNPRQQISDIRLAWYQSNDYHNGCWSFFIIKKIKSRPHIFSDFCSVCQIFQRYEAHREEGDRLYNPKGRLSPSKGYIGLDEPQGKEPIEIGRVLVG